MVHSDMIPIQRSKCQLLWNSASEWRCNFLNRYSLESPHHCQKTGREPLPYTGAKLGLHPCKVMSQIHRVVLQVGTLSHRQISILSWHSPAFPVLHVSISGKPSPRATKHRALQKSAIAIVKDKNFFLCSSVRKKSYGIQYLRLHKVFCCN